MDITAVFGTVVGGSSPSGGTNPGGGDVSLLYLLLRKISDSSRAHKIIFMKLFLFTLLSPDIFERVAGIEPASLGWKPNVLPLNYTRNLQATSAYVGVLGLEPRASSSQTRRATNCATLRLIFDTIKFLLK